MLLLPSPLMWLLVRNDFETLYLSAYTITMGKLVEESYGDSELKAPVGPMDLYDRSEPLPKYLEPQIIDGKYIYNAFMLSEESLQLLGNDFAVFYCDFVDAFLSYRSEVPCPEQLYAELLSSVIYYDFPVFNACAQPFELFKHYDAEANTISIEYKYSKDEHQKLLTQFLAAADEMLATVVPDMSDIEKAKNIYNQICTRMVYDDSALEDLERKDSYFAYLHNSGVSRDSYRIIPVPENIRYCAIGLRDTEDKYIFEGKNKGRPCNPSHYRDKFKEALQGIPEVRVLTPHCCRHTYVSQLQALGVDLSTIQSIVGHADIQMTEHYLHVQEEVRQSAINKFSRAFAPKSDP